MVLPLVRGGAFERDPAHEKDVQYLVGLVRRLNAHGYTPDACAPRKIFFADKGRRPNGPRKHSGYYEGGKAAAMECSPAGKESTGDPETNFNFRMT